MQVKSEPEGMTYPNTSLGLFVGAGDEFWTEDEETLADSGSGEG